MKLCHCNSLSEAEIREAIADGARTVEAVFARWRCSQLCGACRFTLFDGLGARFRKPNVAQAIDAYADVARRFGMTLTQLALGYVNSRWFVGASIIGATSMAQLTEDIAAAQYELSSDALAAIADVQVNFPNPAG